jgi:hypothetical protein
MKSPLAQFAIILSLALSGAVHLSAFEYSNDGRGFELETGSNGQQIDVSEYEVRVGATEVSFRTILRWRATSISDVSAVYVVNGYIVLKKTRSTPFSHSADVLELCQLGADTPGTLRDTLI